MKIEIKKPIKEDLERDGVLSWPIWEKEVSRFDWHHDQTEECYLSRIPGTKFTTSWNWGPACGV